MKDYKAMCKKYYDELVEIGLKPTMFSKITVEELKPGVHALCRYDFSGKSDTFTLRIAKNMVCDKTPEIFLRSLIVHELIHTMPGAEEHGDAWNQYADYVSMFFPDLIITEFCDIPDYTEKI